MAAYIGVRFVHFIGVVGSLEVSEKFSGGGSNDANVGHDDLGRSTDGSLIQYWR